MSAKLSPWQPRSDPNPLCFLLSLRSCSRKSSRSSVWGVLWSQRDKNESLSPSVKATIAQFNAITNRVITSLLRRPVRNLAPPVPPRHGPCPAHRARIIERWITVAQVSAVR